MTQYNLTAEEKRLQQNGFHRDMCFETMNAGAEYYIKQLQKRNYLTATAEGTEPYIGIYVWVKLK